MAVPLACVRSLFKRGYIPALLIFGFANCCRGFAHVSHRHLVRVLFSDQHEPVAPAARRQQPMPLLGSNRASDLANGSMDPDGAWLHSFCRSGPYHKVLDVKRERKSSQIFTYKYAPNLDIVVVSVKLDNHRAVKC